MLNITIICIIFMMMLTALFMLDMNMHTTEAAAEVARISAAEFAIRFERLCNSVRPNRAIRRAYGEEQAKSMFAFAKMANDTSFADEKYRLRTALSVGMSKEDAKKASKDPSWNSGNLGKITSTHFVGKGRFRIGVLSTENAVFNKKAKCWEFPIDSANFAVRGGCILSDYSGFNDGKDGHPTVVVFNWNSRFEDETLAEDEKVFMTFKFNGKTYLTMGGSQGGLKKGIAVAFEESFVKAHEDIFNNERLLKELSTQKLIQRISLMLSTATRTAAKMTQVIVVDKFDREDAGNVIELVPTGNSEKPWETKEAKIFVNALIDGHAIADTEAGLWVKGKKHPKSWFTIIRPTKGGCFVTDFAKLGIAGKTVVDHWGIKRLITRGSIIVTTDCVKDIGAFPASEGKAGYDAWLKSQISENVYVCNTFSHSGWIRISRQMVDKFTQIKDIADLLRVTINHDFTLMNTKQGVIDELQRMFPVLKLPELSNMFGSSKLYEIICNNAVNLYTRVMSGAILLKGSVCYGIPDVDWTVQAYIDNNGKADQVDLSRTAGSIPKNCCAYGKYDWDKNPDGTLKLDEHGLPTVNGKAIYVAVGRYPQINMKMPVLRVVANAPAKGVIAFSMQEGETALVDLDADLDGDEFYVFEDDFIVEAVRKSNKVFDLKTTVFCPMEMNPKAKKASVAQYMYWAKAWSDVGLGIFQIFPMMEVVPNVSDDENWKDIKVPVVVKDGKNTVWKFVRLDKVIEMHARFIAQQGHDRTDAAKRGGQPGVDQKVSNYYSMLALSELYAHPNKEVKATRKRMEEKLEQYPRLKDGIGYRIRDHIENKRGIHLNATLDADGNVHYSPSWVVKPIEVFEGVDESVWMKQLRSGLNDLPKLVLDHKDIEGHAQFEKLYTQGASGNKDAADMAANVYSLIQAFETAHDIQNIDVKDDERDTVKMIDVDMTKSIMAFMRLWADQNGIKATEEELFWIAYNNLAKNYFSESESRPSWAVGQFLRSFREPITMVVLENRGDHPKAHVSEEDPSDGCANMKEVHIPVSEPEPIVPEGSAVMNAPEGSASLDAPEEVSDEDAKQIAERKANRRAKSKKTVVVEEGNDVDIEALIDNIDELLSFDTFTM